MYESDFTTEDALRILKIACAAVGLDSENVALIRFGENAIYRLSRDPVVVRIARSAAFLADVRKELDVGRWLARAGLPSVQPADVDEQPLVIGDRVVSFWQLIPESDDPATVVDLALLLRRLHALSTPDWFQLPVLDPFRRIEHRLSHGGTIPSDDHRFLRDLYDRLRHEYERVPFVMSRSVIHGDAQVSNLIRHVDGTVLLSDLDPCAIGQPEWDLTLTAAYQARLGWHSAAEYRAFAETYGFDVQRWSGFDVLADIRELRMVTWLMQNTAESAEIAAEVRWRITTLRKGTLPRAWNPY